MTNSTIVEILNEIGNLAVSGAPSQPADRILVIAEAERAHQSDAAWQDTGDQVLMYYPPPELPRAVGRLWDAAEPDKKWAMLILEVTDGHFTSEFLYPEDIDPDEDEFERDGRIIAARFGNKEIVYPDRDVSEYTEVTEGDLQERDDWPEISNRK